MKMFMKVIFLTLWLVILLFDHIMLFFDGGESFGVGLLFIAIWWIITLPFIVFNWKKNHNNTSKNKKQIINEKTSIKYENINVEHSYFGKLVFQKNSNDNSLELVSNNNELYKFGDKEIVDDLELNVSEEQLNVFLNSLEKVYKNANNILNESYKQISKLIPDEQGNPISIERVEDNLGLGGIFINDNIIEMTATVKVYEGAQFIIKIDLNTGKVECHTA